MPEGGLEVPHHLQNLELPVCAQRDASLLGVFDEKYPVSHASERDLQLKNAQRVRKTACQKARRAEPPSNELN